MSRKLVTIVVVLAVVMIPLTAHATRAEHHIQHWTNRARRNHGVATLEWRDRLHHVALREVRKMIACRCLTHSVHPPCKTWGQNIGLGLTARAIWHAWKTSPEHWANILDPRFRRGGVAVRRAHGLAWAAAEFCG